MMRKLSKRAQSNTTAISSTPSGDEWHHDIMAYLGYINVSLAALAGLRLYDLSKQSPSLASSSDLDVLALLVLGIANGSQAFGNFGRARKSKRWIMGSGWDRITVLDAAFMVLDCAVVVGYFLEL